MDTGILSVLLHLDPHQFHGLDTISTVAFIWNFLLFLALATASLFHIVFYPSFVRTQTPTSLDELCYTAAPIVVFFTLVAHVILTCSEAWGYGFMMLAYVLWWSGCGV